MIRRLILAVLLLSASYAAANTYNDVFFDVAEPGWGVFVKQSNKFQFLAFYIYGQTGQPTWYTAQLTNSDGTGLNYSGPLFATTGTYFANAWQGYVLTQVGTASFQGSAVPEDYFHATLTYTVNGVTVTKAIQRQNLTDFALSGTYSGSIAGSVSSCADVANNGNVNGRFSLNLAQAGDASAATLTFNFVDTAHSGMVCTLNGPLTHYGGLYTITGAQYACSAGGFSPGTVVSVALNLLDQTGQGVEGKWTATTSAGCSQTIRFSAVSN